MQYEIVKASPSDAPILSSIAKKSKKHWGYSDEQIEKWENEFLITSEEILNQIVFFLKTNNETIGFYSLWNKEGKYELEHLWLLPNFIGKGLGKKLFDHLINTAKRKKVNTFCIISDPNAESFYIKMGAIKIDEKESSIPGRMLPILQYSIT